MSDATSTGVVGSTLTTGRRGFGAMRGVVATLLAAIWAPIAALLEPVDRLFQPFADVFNRTLGGYYGQITGLQLFVLVASFTALLTLPEWGHDYNRAIALGCIWAIFAMAWDIQSGYTGYISFGHSALSGIAGYTVGILGFNADIVNEILYIGTPPVPRITIPLAVLAALVLGLAIALVSLRLRGPYFSLVTLVTVLLLFRLIRAFNEYTNGENGISGYANGLVGLSPAEPINRYYLMLYPMLVIAFVLVTIARSNVGLVLTAIRENEPAVSAAGISPTKFKIWSFVISSVPMGIGGAMFAYFLGSANRTDLVMIDNSIQMIAMSVVGGMASILGPLFGAIGFIFLEEEILKNFFGPSMRGLALWTLVIVIFVFARDGLFRRIWHGLGAVQGRNGLVVRTISRVLPSDGGDSE